MFGDAWGFERQPDELVQTDPNEEQFFTGEEEDESVFGLTDALVRECIQNSLDATTKQGPVTVRFTIRATGPDTATMVGRYFSPLSAHLAACDVEEPKLTKPTTILAIEDSGTRGLGGDPARREEPAPGSPPEDWFWFWWRVGKSSKSGRDRGRWGLGRSVIAATSRIRTFFGLTLRADDDRLLLMGQTKLKTHTVGAQRFVAHGWFRTTRGDEKRQLPFEAPEPLAEFERDFGTSRRTLGPGLSLIVPFPNERLRAHALARSVVAHWFLPILKGELRVEVVGPDLRVVLAQDTIAAESARLRWDDKPKRRPPPLDLAKWLLGKQAAQAVPGLPLAGVQRLPSWSDVEFPADLEGTLREAYDRGDPIAVRVNMTVEQADGRREPSYFDIALQRDPDVERGQDCFIRQGMTISKVSTLGPYRHHRGIVLVEHRELSALLGDTEGPAHEEWVTGESRPDKNFRHWKGRVPFVKGALPALVRRFTAPTHKVMEDLLIDVFSVDDGAADGPGGGGRGAGRGRRRRPDVPPPPARPSPYALVVGPSGFRISGVPGRCTEGTRVRVRVAFDIPEGNPLKAYHPFDFDLQPKRANPIRFVANGCKIDERRSNAFDVVAQVPDFTLEVEGFDGRRGDVYVHADLVPENGGAA